MTNARPEFVSEEFLRQIRTGPDALWEDYTRGVESESRRWQRGERANRRVVDWIDKERVLMDADGETVLRPTPSGALAWRAECADCTWFGWYRDTTSRNTEARTALAFHRHANHPPDDDALLAGIMRNVLRHGATARVADGHLHLDAVVMINDTEAAALTRALSRGTLTATPSPEETP